MKIISLESSLIDNSDDIDWKLKSDNGAIALDYEPVIP